MYHIGCAEIWGGVRGEDVDACTNGIIASLYSSAADGEEGGDIYYMSACSSGMISRVALADVRGHGEAVSDISRWLYLALQARMNTFECSGILTELHHVARQRGYRAITTAAVIAFFRADSHLYFSYAGHPPMFAYRRNAQCWEPVLLRSPREGANLPLAALPESTYDQDFRPLTTGDRLFLYTDGVTEAPNREQQHFGQARLQRALEQAADGSLHDLKESVLGALLQHTGGSLAHDDVTFMALEVR